MAQEKPPVTAAIRLLRQHQVSYTDHLYEYQEHGGTATSAQALAVDEHCVIKTLIMEDDNRSPLIVLMHGDREVSTKNLARHIGVKSVSPCKPDVANKHSGYMVGGTSPFGTRKAMPVFLEKSILDLPAIYLNGGKRGYLVRISPADVVRLLHPEIVEVGIER